MDVDLRLPANLADDRRRRLERVAETCPVRKALETGIEVRETQPARNVPAGCEMRERGRG